MHHKDQVLDVGFDFTGQYLVSASLDGTGRVYNALTQQPISILEGHENEVSKVARFFNAYWCSFMVCSWQSKTQNREALWPMTIIMSPQHFCIYRWIHCHPHSWQIYSFIHPSPRFASTHKARRSSRSARTQRPGFGTPTQVLAGRSSKDTLTTFSAVPSTMRETLSLQVSGKIYRPSKK